MKNTSDMQHLFITVKVQEGVFSCIISEGQSEIWTEITVRKMEIISDVHFIDQLCV